MLKSAPAPFVLLDDARLEGAPPARLFRNPEEILSTREPSEVAHMLERLRGAGERGLHAAGFIAFEAGYALERKLRPLSAPPPPGAPPLIWFGLFRTSEEIADRAALLPDPASAWTTLPRPLIMVEDYQEAVALVKSHIAAGDIYQANLTFAAEVQFDGSPLGVYAALRSRARAGFGAVVFTGEHWLLSFSPELFFTLERGRLTTRPMKGTAERGSSPEEDRRLADELRSDPKQRAENLMIVDLLRNDLSRVSTPGSVKVPELFTVETYPTVHQMTSTVTAELQPGRDALDVLGTMFPCGSVTGAPKIRAMEIIAELERHRRNVYTGSIGTIAPRGDAAFSVAIRTLTIRSGEKRALIGLGSGIVDDSESAAEWRECLAKGAFVFDPDRNFDLVETMRFDPHDGISDIERHLARMGASAEALGFAFNRHDARNELQAATFRLREPKKLRLLLSRSGAVAIEARSLPSPPGKVATVALAPLPVPPHDFRLRHKTSDRGFYDQAREAAGTFEVIFADDAGFLTEGSFSNIFVEREGKLVTPPLVRGLLAGVLRERLLAEGEAVEGDLVAADLVDGFYIGNAVRGLMPAVLR